jgi:hypothetical protein
MSEEVKFNAEGPNSQQSFGDIINNITNNYEYIQKKLPSYLAKVVFYLEKVLDDTILPNISPEALYDVEVKIAYNNVVKYKETIENYGNYGATIDRILEALDNEKPNSKKRFLWNINQIYLLVLGDVKKNYSSDENIEKVVNENSDEIIDAVFDKLKYNYLNSFSEIDIMLEDLEICLIIIVCKSFIDCKILEKPKL